MKMIKKLILIFTAAVCAASCWDQGPTYSGNYQLDTEFEYSGLKFNSDSLYFESQEGGKGFAWTDLAFYHKLDESGNVFKGGFILSQLKGSGSGNDRFRVNSGVGMANSPTYVVYYRSPFRADMPDHSIEFISKEYGTCEMIGCYVNNTKEVVDSIKNNFKPGDKLSIRMTGYLDGKETGSREYVLAEYTEAKDSLVTEWSPFELGKLGSIEYVDIEVLSTNENVPRAFCMDDMFAKVSVSF